MKQLIRRREFGMLVLLIVLCAVVATLNPRFLGQANLMNTARLIGMYGILSIGVGLVIMTGGIDLSVGSVIALLGTLLAMALTEWHLPWMLALLAALLLATVLGWFHGRLVTRVGLQPFVVTLCGLLFYRGIARFIAGDETKGFGTASGFEPLQYLATGELLGVPMPFVLLVIVAVVMGGVLQRTVYGRYLFAVGRNEQAARYSGINTRRIIVSSYVLCAAFTAVSAVLFAFYTNSVSPSSHGNFYELYGIAAAVLGGCALTGGEGSVFGIVIGSALLQVLQNLVNLLGIPSSLNFAVMGAVILVGVIADRLLKARSSQWSHRDGR
jgi:ribose transport system permease protein